MSNMKQLGWGALLSAALLGGSMTASAADWGGAEGKDGGWGDKGDMAGHHMMKEEKGAGSDKSWGMSEGEGHMTMRMRMVWNLDLDDKQRSKIRALQREARTKSLEIDDKIEDISDKLFKLYRADVRDAKAIGKVYSEIFDLRRQKIEMMIDYGNKVEDALDDKQRAQLKKFRFNPRWGAMH